MRSPTALLYQRDLHAIILVVLIDLSLTVEGILHHGGTEINPFFRPMTEMGLEPMLAGIGFYIVVLCTLSLVLAGGLRKILASVVFGMHVVGVTTWFFVVDAYLGTALDAHMNLFWYLLLGTGATALFFYAEDIGAAWKNRRNG